MLSMLKITLWFPLWLVGDHTICMTFTCYQESQRMRDIRISELHLLK